MVDVGADAAAAEAGGEDVEGAVVGEVGEGAVGQAEGFTVGGKSCGGFGEVGAAVAGPSADHWVIVVMVAGVGGVEVAVVVEVADGGAAIAEVAAGDRSLGPGALVVAKPDLEALVWGVEVVVAAQADEVEVAVVVDVGDCGGERPLADGGQSLGGFGVGWVVLCLGCRYGDGAEEKDGAEEEGKDELAGFYVVHWVVSPVGCFLIGSLVFNCSLVRFCHFKRWHI